MTTRASMFDREPLADARFTRVLAAVESRVERLHRRVIAFGLVLATIQGYVGFVIAWRVATPMGELVNPKQVGVGACAGIIAAVVEAVLLRRVLFRALDRSWREAIRRDLDATESELDDALALFR